MVDNELKGFVEDAAVPKSRQYLEVEKKTTKKLSQDSPSPLRDSNQAPLELNKLLHNVAWGRKRAKQPPDMEGSCEHGE
jgi:hypothetical protein